MPGVVEKAGRTAVDFGLISLYQWNCIGIRVAIDKKAFLVILYWRISGQLLLSKRKGTVMPSRIRDFSNTRLSL